ncbi:MAG: tetratricopeptide repeat protein [Planctomyces sp.]|nr:tetratricopeptide repeat protein [Planctomyces sp.]
MTESNVNSQKPIRSRWRRRFLIVLVAIAVICLWKRHAIWPQLFHIPAERALSQHRAADAVYWIDWADAIQSENPDTALLRVRAVRRMGIPQAIDEAMAEAQRRGVNPRSLQRERILYAAQSGRMRQCDPLLSSLLTDISGDNKDVCLAYVTGYLRNQRTSDALLLIDAWMKDAPEDGYPWLIRARIRRVQQDLVAAEKDLGETLQRSPGWIEAQIELAEIYSDSGRAAEAVELFRNADGDPALRSRAVTGLAIALKSTGKPDESLEVLRNQVKADSENAQLWLEIGRTEFENGDYEEGREALERAIQLKPWAEDARYVLAQCLRQLGENDAADRQFAEVEKSRAAFSELAIHEQELRKNPQSAELLTKIGSILLSFGDPQEGVLTLLAAIDLDPNQAAAHEQLAKYYERRAESDSAAKQSAELHRREFERITQP